MGKRAELLVDLTELLHFFVGRAWLLRCCQYVSGLDELKCKVLTQFCAFAQISQIPV